MLALVLPIVLSAGWTLLIQFIFLVAAVVLFRVQNRRPQEVERPLIRLSGEWVLRTVCVGGAAAALALAVFARSEDSAWLGGAALLINVAAFVVAYGGHGFLIRRHLARLT